MDHQETRRRFATLTTAHLADACIRAHIPVRCAPALLQALVPVVALEVQAAGLEGIVIWGLHRDTADIRAIGLPVFSLGAIPTGPFRLDARAHDALESAVVGDSEVSREDLVLGDEDGVLFLPSPQAEEIFTLAETIRDTERRQAERIRAGASLRSQVQFRAYLAKRENTPSLSFREHLRTVGGAVEE